MCLHIMFDLLFTAHVAELATVIGGPQQQKIHFPR